MSKITLFFILFILFFSGCARQQTLNMEGHRYSNRPENVIWIQVPGLSLELIALLKLINKDAGERLSLERAQCVGKFWNFNLFEMQPDSKKGLISQINGSKNIKGNCEDFGQKPVWRYFRDLGYKTTIVEQINSLEESVMRAKACGSSETYIDDQDLFLVMSAQKLLEGGSFHRLDNQWPNSGIFFDKACLSGACASSLDSNVIDFFQSWNRLKQNKFLMIRTFELEKAIRDKNLTKIREVLVELNRMSNYFTKLESSKTLLLITGSGAIDVQFPNNPKAWLEFEKQGKNLNFNSSNLFSTSFAFGAMSESFCGIYNESDILRRILYIPPNKKFDWDYLIPF